MKISSSKHLKIKIKLNTLKGVKNHKKISIFYLNIKYFKLFCQSFIIFFICFFSVVWHGIPYYQFLWHLSAPYAPHFVKLFSKKKLHFRLFQLNRAKWTHFTERNCSSERYANFSGTCSLTRSLSGFYLNNNDPARVHIQTPSLM